MLRHKYLFKKNIRYRLWQPHKLQKKLFKSFLKNYKINYMLRYSLLWQPRYTNGNHRFYLSQNKLQCFLHYSFSVPAKNVNTSRFFLTKSLDSLMYGGYQKN